MEKGVFQAKKKDGSTYYRASVTHHQKHISLGSFATEQSAGAAYREARALLSSPSLSFRADYTPRALSFEKYVTLMNFRDNHYYFASPIYAYPRYFLYFLSREIVFKFDTDDLFYYASHKIMKRGGHYFVADYGMQVSLPGRYGIKPYAVVGRDYRFINDDPYDFRYENIRIINRYHGVRLTKKAGRSLYRAVIHIRSHYVVGDFSTETEAAIAYNKAADILIKNGFTRNFMQNYVENVSPSEYAAIYDAVPIPEKLMRLTP
ncbi:MAG: hypothetical protein NC409_12355 [Clostridium sp.]|nr:hypothetical protein [Clostridium sp.]